MSPLELTAPIRILAETKTFVQQLDNFELVFLLIEPFSLTHGHSLGTAAVTSLQASMISHVGAKVYAPTDVNAATIALVKPIQTVGGGRPKSV
jgi:hypothetical protein